jgi:hypothetical protein
MDPRDIRTWVENQRAAAARVAKEARRHRMTPDEAFDAALALLRLDELQNGSPFERRDPVTEREDREMWETWAKLRERWPRER